MSTTEVSSKPYDLIVFGATSFVGQILSNYLVETIGVNGDISWAIASRSESKLTILKNSIGTVASELPV